MTAAAFDFDRTVRKAHAEGLSRGTLRTLQVNVGKLCNQACNHCHVEAGPNRTEQMTRATAEHIMKLLALSPEIETVDITGGAPELNENFELLVREASRLGKHIIDRCNLTVLFEPGQENLLEFLAEYEVEVVASLPCYTQDNVDKQRGRGVFDKSIEALRLLNKRGYGLKGSNLALNLVYNPGGAFLPPAQDTLEARYKQELRDNFGVEFNSLYTITNMPISRFLDSLRQEDRYTEYMQLLVEAYNPGTIEDLMCRSVISISWDGYLYDCDFNQMLDLPTPLTNGARVLPLVGGRTNGARGNVMALESFDELEGLPIAVAEHCFGCTAGAGSSCGGSLQ